MNGVQYPKDPIETNYSEDNYLGQKRDLKGCYKANNGEPLSKPFISYLDLKTFFPIPVIDLAFQIDYVTSKKKRRFEGYETAHENTKLYVTLIKHKECILVSHENKVSGTEFV